MARTSRNKPTSRGPGRGSPRTRTAARPGERVSRERVSTKPLPVVAETPVKKARPAKKPPQPGGVVLGMTWRLIIVAVVVAALALTLGQSLRVYFAQAAELAAVRAEIKASQDEISQMQDQLNRWNDPAYVKAQARQRLGWVMPGETGYRVVGLDGKALGGDSAVLAEEAPPKGPWWQQVWGSVAVADEPAPEPEKSPSPTAAPSTIGPPPSASPSASATKTN